ncbi:MAG TPA: hypothetical protein VFB52_04160 [Solirubrobacterales bacterium]|nr:hypothetical protein [Solirubrobacterales bacterium]
MRGKGAKFVALGTLMVVLVACGAAGADDGPAPPWEQAKLDATVFPKRLPSDGFSPVRLELSSWVRMKDERWPPPLRELSFHLDRDVRFDLAGIPTCGDGGVHSEIATSYSSLERECADALVGRGEAVVASSLVGDTVVRERIPLIVVNAVVPGEVPGEGRTRLYVVGGLSIPVPITFVAPVYRQKRRHGDLGTVLRVVFPKLVSGAGSLNWLRLRINRRTVVDGGREHAVVAARCPDRAFQANLEATYVYPQSGGEYAHSEQRVRRCGRR